KDRAPRVVAKGMDQLALRIVKVAEENNVYVTEDRPLARALYDAVEVGDEIPEEFYKAIAKVLAFVYNLKNKENKSNKK
ncbi:MAG: EscU/YscU/HrcU family type III secretion system export apparatus switch protein, partial [Clostridia bacterium]|nr:EscU/YscU/HrcU family type III secretion system export apparatus switch protein [Clostridia bacterium]